VLEFVCLLNLEVFYRLTLTLNPYILIADLRCMNTKSQLTTKPTHEVNMADTDHTLGYRFAESKFYAKTYTSHSIDQFVIKNESKLKPGSHSSPNSGSAPQINHHLLNATLAELLETLRLHVHSALHLPLSVQTRSRLVRVYCDIESRSKEMRLLLNPVDIAAALELLGAMQKKEPERQSSNLPDLIKSP